MTTIKDSRLSAVQLVSGYVREIGEADEVAFENSFILVKSGRYIAMMPLSHIEAFYYREFDVEVEDEGQD